MRRYWQPIALSECGRNWPVSSRLFKEAQGSRCSACNGAGRQIGRSVMSNPAKFNSLKAESAAIPALHAWPD
jgi:hypothetical protein